MKYQKRRTRRVRDAEPATEGGPALPAWKAFVVQFSRECGAQAGTFSGRVEHLDSGQRVRFGSAEELHAVLLQMLKGIKDRD